jgi:hypothetical protein
MWKNRRMQRTQRDRVRAHSPQTPTVRCTLQDRMVRQFTAPMVFFYDRPLDADAIAHGLGRVLGDFCVFNGELVQRRGELFIECNDIGASFSIVERATTMQHALATLEDPRERMQLVEMTSAKPRGAKPNPLLSVRITQFVDGTSCLGVCFHHSIGDMQTFALFMRAWSQAAAGLAYDRPLVVEEREAYLDAAIAPTSRAKPSVRYLGVRQLAGFAAYLLTRARDRSGVCFHFGPRELEALRASVQSESSERLSTNDVLCAHMFSLIAARDPKPRSRHLGIPVNFRKRVGLPEALLGNMLSAINVWTEPGTHAAAIAGELRRSVDGFADLHMDYRANKAFAAEHGGASKASRFLMKGIDPINGSLLVTNWSKFGIYDVGFGGAGPRYFTGIGDTPFPWLSVVLDGFDNHGLLFSALLPAAIASQLNSEAGLREVHRFRDADSELPKIAHGLPWVR